jgi:hypothetical protein
LNIAKVRMAIFRATAVVAAGAIGDTTRFRGTPAAADGCAEAPGFIEAGDEALAFTVAGGAAFGTTGAWAAAGTVSARSGNTTKIFMGDLGQI